MHLMYGDHIKSISIIENHRRLGRVVLCENDFVTEENAVLCLLAGPVAEVFYRDPNKLSKTSFYDLYDMAHSEGVFNVVEGRPKITTNKYLKHLSLCVEIMAESDFRSAVKLLASRLMEHKYLSRERVIRMKDCALWDIYSTSDARVKHAKKSPKKAISQMIRRNVGETLH